MARVLVTGASGFIGFHLTEALAARGDEVTCLVRRSSQVERLRPLGVRLAYGDVTDAASVLTAVRGQQTVYHVAGCIVSVRTADFYRANTLGPQNVAVACAAQTTPPVLVQVSSLAAAGPACHGRMRTEADRPIQVSHYGRSKRAGERAAERFADRVPITVVRPPIVIGEADRLGLEMFRMIDRFGLHLVPGLARYHYSIIHAADLVNLLLLAAERGRRLQPAAQNGHAAPLDVGRSLTPSCLGRSETPSYNTMRTPGYYFAAGHEHPAYADLGRMIAAALGRRRVLLLPTSRPVMWAVAAGTHLLMKIRQQPLYFNLDKFEEASAGSWLCSPQAAEDELGFRVDVPLSERIRQTAEWYRREKWL
jgi:nucleoside-diphosphate-sugar epimerase